MYLTPENAKDYVGMKLYADRSIFRCYPLTVFQYPDGTYATKDSAGVCSPVSNDLFNQVWFDRAEPYKEKKPGINRASHVKYTPKKTPTGYFVKRINVTAGGDITIIGKRFICGEKAEPYATRKSAETALKAQIKQDNELCGDMVIEYFIIEA